MTAGAGFDQPRGEAAAPIGIAVLGTGRIGRLHAGLIAREVPGARLVVVSDVNPESAQACAADLGVRSASVDEILADPAVDAVAVCSPWSWICWASTSKCACTSSGAGPSFFSRSSFR